MQKNFEPLQVTAHLANGFAHNDPWSPALDAILAYWHLYQTAGADEFACQQTQGAAMTPVEGLPLAVERHGDWWWYACSAPIYAAQAEFSRFFHRRFDAHHAERYMIPKKGRVSVQGGPYKAFRLSARITVCDRVDWYCIGDGEQIERLLRYCSAIGYRANSGNGRVLRWEVRPGGDERLARLHRPLPVEFAESSGIEGARLQWGIRPPGRIRVNQTLCIMPEVSHGIAA